MIDTELRAVLHAHTIDAPDADAVHVGIRHAISRRRKQRQATQAAGVAIVVGGLAVAVPVLARGGGTAHPIATTTTLPAAAPPPPSTVKATPFPTTGDPYSPSYLDDVENAYFQRGYDYNDAEQLAALWKLDDPSEAKALAGELVQDGQALPIGHGQSAADAPAAAPLAAQARANFAARGYTAEDAEALAAAWHVGSDGLSNALDTVTVVAGQRLLDGKTLPVSPTKR